jgi:hypothetical protein
MTVFRLATVPLLVILCASGCTRDEATLKRELLDSPGSQEVLGACALEAARRTSPRAAMIEGAVAERGMISTAMQGPAGELLFTTCLEVGQGKKVDDALPVVVHQFFYRADVKRTCEEWAKVRGL